jgi:hypothetical protein
MVWLVVRIFIRGASFQDRVDESPSQTIGLVVYREAQGTHPYAASYAFLTARRLSQAGETSTFVFLPSQARVPSIVHPQNGPEPRPRLLLPIDVLPPHLAA